MDNINDILEEMKDEEYVTETSHVYRTKTFFSEQDAKEWYNEQKIALKADGFDVFEPFTEEDDWFISPIAKIFSNNDIELWEAAIEGEKIDRDDFPLVKGENNDGK